MKLLMDLLPVLKYGLEDSTGDVTVASGAKLIIEPGTTVTFLMELT